jgi:hypothetical protein
MLHITSTGRWSKSWQWSMRTDCAGWRRLPGSIAGLGDSQEKGVPGTGKVGQRGS